MIDLGRRKLIALPAFGAACLAIPAGFAWGREDDSEFWRQPRRLRLFRPQTNEGVSEVYWSDGKLVESGYFAICQHLRDAQINQSVYMDVRLLDLCRAVQGYMEFYGFNKPLVINSGYRSPATNARTEGAAKNSMHLHGQAIDFSMSDIPSNYMGALASHFQGGGVGFYPGAGFTHMDTGAVRYWVGGPKILSRP